MTSAEFRKFVRNDEERGRADVLAARPTPRPTTCDSDFADLARDYRHMLAKIDNSRA